MASEATLVVLRTAPPLWWSSKVKTFKSTCFSEDPSPTAPAQAQHREVEQLLSESQTRLQKLHREHKDVLLGRRPPSAASGREGRVTFWIFWLVLVHFGWSRTLQEGQGRSRTKVEQS